MGIFDWLFGKSKNGSGDIPANDNQNVSEKIIVYSSIEEQDGQTYEWKQYNDGSWSMESDIGEPFKSYFELSEIIVREKDIYKKLEACEKSFDILSQVMKLERNQVGKIPDSIACRDYAPKLYMRLGQWSNAVSAIKKCIKTKAYLDKEWGKNMLEYCEIYKQTVEIAINFLRDNEGFLQKNIYKVLADTNVDTDCLKDFTRSSLLIKKVKKGGTNQLFLNEDVILQSEVNIS